MPGLVTTPPQIIDVSHYAKFTEAINANYISFSSESIGASIRLGGFVWGGYIYAVLQNYISPEGIMGIYRSPITDGLVWTRLDAAHQPSYDYPNTLSQFDASTGIIWLAYGEGGHNVNTIKINSFNCNTQLYGTEVSTTPALGGPFEQLQLVRLSTGDLYVYILYNSGTNWQIYYVKYASSIFSSAILVESDPITIDSTLSLLSTYVDPSDRTGLIYEYATRVSYPTASVVVSYRQIDASGGVGSASVIKSYTGTPSGGTDAGAIASGRGIIHGDAVWIPYAQTDNTRAPLVLVGTTLSAPTWSFVSPDSGAVIPSGAGIYYIFPIIVPDISANPTYFVVVFSGGSAPPNVNQIWMVTYKSGAWQTPVLFQDSIANPPAGTVDSPNSNEPIAADAVQLSSGRWLFLTQYEVFFDMSGPDYTTGYAMVTMAGPSLACPLANTGEVGIPYSSSLTASGGTAPYTFAITVGTLPPGLALNASTGLISGTPTTPGTYPYTAQVTDTNGLIGTASCSITIVVLGLACPSFGTLDTGVFYSASFTASGGTPPYGPYAITSGSLPPGMTLNTATGLVSGTPTAPGTYPYTGQVTDSLGATATAMCSITVVAFSGASNVYTLDPGLLTDDDFGALNPYYTTYAFPDRDQEQQLQLGGHMKMVSYTASYISGVGYLVLTILCENLANAWPVNSTGEYLLQAGPQYDLEWPGGQATAQRFFQRFAVQPNPAGSTASPATDVAFTLTNYVMALKPNKRYGVRGSYP
jgi:hypothetical protein